MSTSQKHSHDSEQTRIALLEQSIGHIDQTLLRIESRINNIDVKVENMENSFNLKIDKLENKLNSRIDKIDSRLWQIMFLISSSVIGLIVAKILHWI